MNIGVKFGARSLPLRLPASLSSGRQSFASLVVFKVAESVPVCRYFMSGSLSAMLLLRLSSCPYLSTHNFSCATGRRFQAGHFAAVVGLKATHSTSR